MKWYHIEILSDFVKVWSPRNAKLIDELANDLLRCLLFYLLWRCELKLLDTLFAGGLMQGLSNFRTFAFTFRRS